MAKYKLAPELDGIEIYFDEKPNSDIRKKLVDNHWRWNGKKSCWYTKYSKQAEKLAKELCDKACKDFIAKPISPVKSVGNSVSFEQKSNAFTTRICIKKVGDKYDLSSTNNQIACVDCNRFFSIHAPACIFCGCPISHTIKTYYKKQIIYKTQELQKQAEAREIQRQKEEIEYKKKCIKIFEEKYYIYLFGKEYEALLNFSIEKFKKIEERAKLLYKCKKQRIGITSSEWFRIVQLSDVNFQKKVDELIEKRNKELELQKIEAAKRQREKEKYFESCENEGFSNEFISQFWAEAIPLTYIRYCSSTDIPEKTIILLWKKKITLDELKNRISTIDYYIRLYPHIDLGHAGHTLLTVSELNEYVKKRR